MNQYFLYPRWWLWAVIYSHLHWQVWSFKTLNHFFSWKTDLCIYAHTWFNKRVSENWSAAWAPCPREVSDTQGTPLCIRGKTFHQRFFCGSLYITALRSPCSSLNCGVYQGLIRLVFKWPKIISQNLLFSPLCRMQCIVFWIKLNSSSPSFAVLPLKFLWTIIISHLGNGFNELSIFFNPPR